MLLVCPLFKEHFTIGGREINIYYRPLSQVEELFLPFTSCR